MKPVKKSSKTDLDLQQEGRVLIMNGLKAHSIAVENIEAYLVDPEKITEKNWGCYMLQQSIELILKGLIKYYCEDFREGHLVKYNANFLLELSAKYSELRELSDILNQLVSTRISAEMFKWQSIARYKEIWTKNSYIEQADEISEVLTQYIHRHDYLED